MKYSSHKRIKTPEPERVIIRPADYAKFGQSYCINRHFRCVLFNMAIFKMLCFIGFVLLSSSHAREYNGRHRSLHHDHHFHKYRHILKRHVTAQGHSPKRSKKVEDSSKVWLHKGNENSTPAKLKQVETNKAIPDKGFPSGGILLPSGKKPVRGNSKIVPTQVVTLPGGNNFYFTFGPL